MATKAHVVVIGAGVIGLQSAVLLAETGHRVTVVATHVPGDRSIEYTSPWAGAHWRTHATPADPQQCRWDVETFDHWVNLLRREDDEPSLPKSGLKMVEALDYWDDEVEEDIWWSPYVQDFRALSELQGAIAAANARVPPGGPKIKAGVAYRTFAVDVPRYLLYLQEKARSLGATVIKSRLPTEAGFEEALTAAESKAKAGGDGSISCFVNATGLGAAKVCGDQAMYPIRGQTVLVKGEANATVTRIADGYSSYCIPRPGTGATILGGTKQPGNWSEEVDPQTTKMILERGKIIAPELCSGPDGGFEVISVQCGLRPGRKGGHRYKKERVGERKVVHAYGNAGGGYQNSIGAAREVLRLVNESIGTSSMQDAKL